MTDHQETFNTAPPLNEKIEYRPELDGLRAIAVISVMCYHAHLSLFKGGYVGVDVFFVLSGFLMSSIILREKEANKFTLQTFYERRARRILPMLTLTLAVSYIPAYLFMISDEFAFFTKSAFFSTIAAANVLYSKTTKGYFDTSVDRIPLIHTWTLGVEEQFYFIIPLIFILFWRFGKYSVCGIIAIMAIVSFLLTFLDTINSIHKFYMLYTRFWEMAIGSLIVFVPKQPKSDAASFAGLASILTAILMFDDNFPDPSYYTLLPTCGTALLILYSSKTKIAAILSNSNLLTIGLVSYSAYLIHQPMFAFYRIQSLRVLYPNDFVVLIIITLLMSYATWRFVENPFRNKNKVSFKILICTFAASALVLFIFCICSLSINFGNSTSSVKNSTIIEYNSSKPGEPAHAKTSLNRYIEVYGGVTLPEIYDTGRCHSLHHEKKFESNPLFCRIGSDMFKLPPTYFLTGDSISLHFVPAFDAIPGSGVFASIGDACATTLVATDSAQMSVKTVDGYRCWMFHEHVYNYIKNNATSIRTLFVASNFFAKLHYPSVDLDIIYAIKKYAMINVTVYLIEQPPVQLFLPIGVYENLKRQSNLTDASIRAHSLSVDLFLDYDLKMYQPFLKRIHESSPLIHIKTRNYFCDDKCCPIGTANSTYYIDNVHINPSGAFFLIQLFSSIV
jgi:peptidoglycan/LPS O-acetylase OafA/YrhL